MALDGHRAAKRQRFLVARRIKCFGVVGGRFVVAVVVDFRLDSTNPASESCV